MTEERIKFNIDLLDAIRKVSENERVNNSPDYIEMRRSIATGLRNGFMTEDEFDKLNRRASLYMIPTDMLLDNRSKKVKARSIMMSCIYNTYKFLSNTQTMCDTYIAHLFDNPITVFEDDTTIIAAGIICTTMLAIIANDIEESDDTKEEARKLLITNVTKVRNV